MRDRFCAAAAAKVTPLDSGLNILEQLLRRDLEIQVREAQCRMLE